MTGQRGVAIFVFIVAVVGGSLSGALVYEGFAGLQSAEDRRAAAAQTATQNARAALLNYMLARTTRPFNIARPGGAAILPRLLMLPCPDNVGDHNLDGTQDPTCGADGDDITNGVLSSGARFGRLPYRQKFSGGEDEINDGLAGDFSGGGGMLWYAVAQNFAPAVANPNGGAPLNLHRLDAREEGWLSLAHSEPARSSVLLTLNSRVAAVALAPGKFRQGRKADAVLATMSLNLGDISASAYFESAGGESNADANGVFVRMSRPAAEFDDELDFIAMHDLLNPDGNFMRNYLAAAGVGPTHNAPAADSPLAEIRRAFSDWKNFFGFYPIPAANANAHIDGRRRHCAAHHIAAGGATVTIADITLLSPAAANVLTLTGNSTTITAATATLQNETGFLIASPATVTLPSVSAVVADNTVFINGSLTLARYARITLSAGTSVVVATAALISGNVLPPGAGAVLSGETNAFVAGGAPLSPRQTTEGWLPEHHRTTVTIARDGARLSLLTATRAGFLGEAVLTSAARTISVSSQDRLFLRSSLHIEKDFSQLTFLYDDALLISDGAATTLSATENYKPDADSFARRRFVVALLSDIPRASITIFAPQIVYPWRDNETRAGVSRDNLHPYPPCFDSRALSRRARTFMEDQNIFYAISPDCMDGGACDGGITISVAEGVSFAAPSPTTLTNSFTATIHSAAIQVNDGAPSAVMISNITHIGTLTIGNEFVIPLGASAAAVMPEDFVFRQNEQIVVPAAATIFAGTQTRINAEAVMIYSPAPLRATGCVSGMPPPNVFTVNITAARATQGGGGADLTNFCQWLDDDENADGDFVFQLRRPSADAQTNDYFLFFGGQVLTQ